MSGPAFSITCSLNMITSTEAANPVPRAIENCPKLAAQMTLASRHVLRFAFGHAGGLRAFRAKASGTTIRLRAGAATIPIATADWPSRMLTATSTAKIVRKHDSERISAVNRPKRRCPAR